jgi:hypothetical protein
MTSPPVKYVDSPTTVHPIPHLPTESAFGKWVMSPVSRSTTSAAVECAAVPDVPPPASTAKFWPPPAAAAQIQPRGSLSWTVRVSFTPGGNGCAAEKMSTAPTAL